VLCFWWRCFAFSCPAVAYFVALAEFRLPWWYSVCLVWGLSVGGGLLVVFCSLVVIGGCGFFFVVALVFVGVRGSPGGCWFFGVNFFRCVVILRVVVECVLGCRWSFWVRGVVVWVFLGGGCFLLVGGGEGWGVGG